MTPDRKTEHIRLTIKTPALLGFCVALLVVIVLAIGSRGAEGRTITVDDDGGADYERIQNAVDAAEDGDTIRVYEGIYNGNVVVNKTLSLIGNGSSHVTVDGGNVSSVIRITSDGCNISGLRLINSGYSKIYGGIEVASDNNRIFDNHCTGNRYGICLKNAGDNIVSGNNCSGNNYHGSDISNYGNSGIFIYAGSSNNTVTDNNFSKNGDRGIYISGSHDNELANNTLYYNDGCNIELSEAPGSVLYGNRLTGSGIAIRGESLEDWNTHDINISNLVNGRPIYYYSNDYNPEGDRKVPSGAGQIIIANCTHIVVEDQIWDNGFAGMMAAHSSHISLSNNSCPVPGEGGEGDEEDYWWDSIRFLLWHTSDSTISDNHGNIVLDYSGNNTLENNTCSGNDDGISIEYCSNNTLTGNIITGNRVGIEHRYSANITARYNTIVNNTDYGVDVSSDSPYTMDAALNWWGSNFGPVPAQLELNPYGEGDNVTDNVEFDPWTGKDYMPSPMDLSTIYVSAAAADGGDGSRERPFDRIQDALYHARHGATIYVWEGFYRENVVVDKTVDLIGNGSSRSVINGSGTGDVMLIVADDVTITGFRMENTANDWWYEIWTGMRITSNNNSIYENDMTYGSRGIHVDGGNNNSIRENNCFNNYFGIYVYNGDGNRIEENNCSRNLGGIGLSQSSNCTVDRNRCFDDSDRGIFIGGSSQRIAMNNSITNNTINGTDWGINIGRYTSHSCVYNNQIAGSNLGIHIAQSDDNTIERNHCHHGKKGISLYAASDNLFTDNIVEDNSGNGISLQEAEFNTIIFNIFRNNSLTGVNLTSYSNDNLVENNSIIGNSIGISCRARRNIFRNNNIYGNTGLGFYAHLEYTMNAAYCWWGHESGPYHPTENPTGQGDNVTDYVEFVPWLTEGKPPEPGELSGIVRDIHGSPLEKVHIRITCGSGELYREGFTNENGFYEIRDIPIVYCYWHITASKAGYGDSKISRAINENSVQDFTLHPVEVFYVDDDAPHGGNGSKERPFNKIQYAIDAASAAHAGADDAGAVIYVWEGVYYENVVVDRTVSLIGNGSEVTVIDGGGSGDVVTIGADWVNMSGFGIEGGGGEVRSDAGIMVKSDNNHIFDNNCSCNGYGMYLDHSAGNAIENNSCAFNGRKGIYLYYSDNNVLMDNNWYHNGDGIGFYMSSGNALVENHITWGGLDISGEMEHWNTHDIDPSNTVNGRPIYYFKNLSEPDGITVPADAGQVILASCRHVIVKNLHLSNVSRAISVDHSNGITIVNNTCLENEWGIYLSFSKNVEIMDNIFSGNDNGIGLYDSDYNHVARNNCSENMNGVYIWEHSDNNEFYRNICSRNTACGFYMRDSSENDIENNTFSYNSAGAFLYYSNSNVFRNNSLSWNKYDGVRIDAGDRNTFIDNTCSDNGERGINAEVGESHTFIGNIFSGNRIGLSLSAICRGHEVRYNSFFDNSEYGLVAFGREYEEHAATIDATLNYWGDDSGPYHPTKNPNGTGDDVSDYVDFDPWLGKEEGNEDDTDGSGEDDWGDMTSYILLGLGLFLLGSLAVMTVTVIYTESGRYSFFALVMPLFTRLTRRDVENDIIEQTIRGRIFQHIKENPGTHYSRIMAEVEAGNGTTGYHLGVLERHGFINSQPNGNRRIFFAGGTPYPVKAKSAEGPTNPLQGLILELLADREKEGGTGLSKSGIARATGQSFQTAAYNIGALRSSGMLVVERHGFRTVCRITGKGQDLFEEHGENYESDS